MTFQRPRFMSLMRGTLPWIPPPMKSPTAFAVLCRTNGRTVYSLSSCRSKSTHGSGVDDRSIFPGLVEIPETHTYSEMRQNYPFGQAGCRL